MAIHCCDRMDYDLGQTCSVHPLRVDCRDALIKELRGGYGLIIHDGSSRVIEIVFCPWCGSKLTTIGDLNLPGLQPLNDA